MVDPKDFPGNAPSFSFRQKIVIVVSILLVISLQFVKINRPYAGHFASYQGTVMSAIARNFERSGFRDLLNPRTDAIINGERSLHLNQYPLPSLIVAILRHGFGGTLEFWGRFQAIFFNAASILLMAFIGRRLWGGLCGCVSAMMFAFSPMSVIYGQSMMSEASSLFFLLGAVAILVFHKSSWLARSIASISFSAVLVGRIHWIVFFPALAAVLMEDFTFRSWRRLFIFGVTAALLPVLWYGYTYFAALHASNVHTTLWMQVFASNPNPNPEWLDPNYLLRAGKIIFLTATTPVVSALFVLGAALLIRPSTPHRFFLWFGIGGAASLLVFFPEKIMRQDFYLYGALPFVSFLAGYAVLFVFQKFPVIARAVPVTLLSLLFLIFSARLFMRPVFRASDHESQMVSVARQARSLIPAESSVVVASEDIGVLSYYIDRPNWSFQAGSIGQPLAGYEKVSGIGGRDPLNMAALESARKDPESWIEFLRGEGASYFLIAGSDQFSQWPYFLDYLRQKYKVLSQPDDPFLLFALG